MELSLMTLSWIVVDRHGRRYMNEYPPYLHDTGHREMIRYDEQALTYFLITMLWMHLLLKEPWENRRSGWRWDFRL